MSNILYVYGTLRPGTGKPLTVNGTMYDLGWFPGVILGGTNTIVLEKVEVEDWGSVDQYEGYDPDDPLSLYIRRPLWDGYIYELNRRSKPEKVVEGGDWLNYKQQERGKYGGRFGKSA